MHAQVSGEDAVVAELKAVLDQYAGIDAAMDERKAREVWDLYNYLHRVADSDPDHHVQSKQEWFTLPSGIPVFKTSGRFFVVYVVTAEDDEDVQPDNRFRLFASLFSKRSARATVFVIYCGYDVPDLDALRLGIIEPRCVALGLY